MSVVHWVALGITVLIAVGGVRNLPRIWRHEAKHLDNVPSWWPWGGALWRGYVRAMPTGVIGTIVLLAVFTALALVGEQPSGPFVRPYWVVVPSLVALGLAGAVMLGVVLFNRPKAVVPPHLRDQPGALGEWTGALRRKHASQ